jgi:fructoselysine-6-P-deglycase FrlB-like protein
MSIAVMEREIENQPEDLSRFAKQLAKNPTLPLDPSRTIFTGSGDSYAAALWAEALSKGSARAEDPYELSRSLRLAADRNVVLVSASGKTRANIELARRLKGRARKRIAITSNPESPLARMCDSSIILQYRKSGQLTSGTTSFTASLLACGNLIGTQPGLADLEAQLSRARERAQSVKLFTRGLFLFIGSGIERGLAEYGACKVQEVLGAKAQAQYPEEVGHALLFSLDPSRDNILCVDSGNTGKGSEVARRVRRYGFRVHRVSAIGKNVVAKSLAICFQLQYLVLLNAKRRGMKECRFLQDRKLLELSNWLIY